MILVSAGVCSAATFRSGSGNPLDTTSGYIITAEGADNTLDYQDNQENDKPTVVNTTLETVVASVYGFMVKVNPSKISGEYYIHTSSGVPVTWTGIITNEGNLSYPVRGTLEAAGASSGFIYTGGANNWEAYFIYNGTKTQTIETTLNDNDDESYQLVLWPATAESDSLSGSTGSIRFYSDAYGAPVAGSEGEWWESYYTGGNGYVYGGYVGTPEGEFYRGDIYAPRMVLTRESDIDAPTQYTQGDTTYEAVPGAVITYTLEYRNIGNGTAESVIIIEKVPTYCNAGHVNAITGEVSNINLTVLKATARTWEVWYTTSSTPDKSYGTTSDWTILGTIESDSDYWTKDTTPAFPLTATYVKFEKASLEPADNGKLTWGVIIR